MYFDVIPERLWEHPCDVEVSLLDHCFARLGDVEEM